MLVLGALCVLLPLVFASLDPCDTSVIKYFQKEKQLSGLKDLGDKHFYFLAVSSKNAGSSQSVDVKFGKVDGDTVSSTFVYTTGTDTSTVSSNYTLVGDHITTGINFVYFCYCSENLIAGYRCQGEGTKGGSGPKYFIWAAWSKTELELALELSSCEAKIKTFDKDASLGFVPRSKPKTL